MSEDIELAQTISSEEKGPTPTTPTAQEEVVKEGWKCRKSLIAWVTGLSVMFAGLVGFIVLTFLLNFGMVPINSGKF